MTKAPALADPQGFAEPSKTEEIERLQTLWGRIAREPEEIPVLESHLALAEERLASYRRNPEQAHPAFEALDEIARRDPREWQNRIR